jgi:hypothetical protein
VSGSGVTSFDGSGNIRITIATGVPRHFEGEQAYRRGCECFYGANGFGLRGEEMARTLGLSLLKQAAELGHSDGQYRYGRCLLLGEGCEKDAVSGVEYLRSQRNKGTHGRRLSMANVCLTDAELRETFTMGLNISGGRQRNVMRAARLFWVHAWRRAMVLRKIWFAPQSVIVYVQIRATQSGNTILVDVLKVGLVLRKI